MSFTLLVKDEAEEDLQSAYDWYEEQQFGLGDTFLNQIDQSFNEILNNPKAFQKRYKKVRMNFTQQFPFGVHYKIEQNKIVVLAVLHTNRDPKNWRG